MKIRQAYKFRLKTNPDIDEKLCIFAGHSRFVWNKAHTMSMVRLDNKQPILRYNESAFWLTLWKSSCEYAFLKDCHSQVLQQKLRDLDRAFMDGFDKKQPNKRLPKRKKRGFGDSFRYVQGFKIDNKRVYLPKIGWVGFFKSQECLGTPKNMTISRHGKHWYLSIQTEREITLKHPHPNEMIGIDVGVSTFAACSNSDLIEPISAFQQHKDRLAKAQRALKRKKKFSQSWKKQISRIQHIHTKITALRSDFLHKASTAICKNHAIVVVEDLKITNMSASAKGTLEKPGKQVKQKSGLNRSILDQGWGEFRRQLDYKSHWNGGRLLLVNPAYTSQKCAQCGYTHADNRITQSVFVCGKCGATDNADINAAKNILAAGQAVLACGDEALVSSAKQEPEKYREVISPSQV